MKYLAVLGREAELSLAELESVLGGVEPFGGCALIPALPDQNQLGGSVKLAKVVRRSPWAGWDKLKLNLDQLPLTEGKTTFGVSFYGPPTLAGGAKKFALELKKQLPGSARAVVSDSPLTAAQLKFNKVLDKGFELIVAVNANEAILALTESFQDIDWYSKRDYDRPGRDAKVGMLPPKLAQIMINLSKGDKIYDPFCGTGVVLQEALLMGKPASGSDLEPRMVELTEKNLAWLRQQVESELADAEVSQADARTVQIPAGFSVVSEGYLGPPLTKAPSPDELGKLKAELGTLFTGCLSSWSKQNVSRVCLAIPSWRVNWSSSFGPLQAPALIDHLDTVGYNLVRFKHADSRKLIYARKDQLVGRQLLVLEKK